MTEEQKPTPQFVGDKARAKTISLEWPVEYGGLTYTEIHLARLTTSEVAAFQASLAKLAPDAIVHCPIYRDADGAPIPDAVMDALDDDDAFELEKKVADFLPRRFRGAPAGASDPQTGATTEPSSEK